MIVLYLLVAGLLAGGLCFAQSDRGAITGTVTDPTNAVVPGAAIVARNVAAGEEFKTVTTATGNYTLAELPAGTYELTVAAAGFTKYVQVGIGVEVVQTARINVVLQVGSTADSVTVTADATMLRTESAEQSMNLGTERVDKLPYFAATLRNPLTFSEIMPGVVGNTSASAGSVNLRVNGSPATTMRMLVDGQDITATYIDPGHTLEQAPAVEALEEFTLQASNFAAEFGQVTGGLFNYTTKSGTNNYHGTLFLYDRNEFFDAGRAFTNDGTGHHIRSKRRGNNYGVTVGGPVYFPKVYNGRNKTFFFFNLEEYRDATSADTYQTVPTALMRNGDFSEALTGRSLGTNVGGGSIMENMIFDPLTNQTVNGQITRTPFPANAIPISRLDPVSLKIQAMLPQPTRSGVLLNWEQKYTVPAEYDVPSITIDQNFGYNMKLAFYFARFMRYEQARTDGLQVPITDTRDRHIHAYTERLNYDYTVSPTLLLHSVFGYVRHVHDDSYQPGVLSYDPLAGLGLIGNYTPGMPSFNGLSSSNGGGMVAAYGLGMGKFTEVYNEKPTAAISGTLIRGNHTFKTGGEWRNDPLIYKDLTAAPTYGFSPNQTALPYLQSATIGGGGIGLPYASFLLGLTNSASISAEAAPESRKNSWGLYLQDTWKITRKLTLDYGLRWDYQPAPHEINYRNGMFGPTIPNPSAGGLLGGMVYEGYGPGRCNCVFTTTYPYAVGPRLGIAYQIAPKTVLRGGWAIAYGGGAYGGESTAQGVGWNTLNFAPVSFGAQATTLRTGLIYNLADLYSVSLSPGLQPQAGTINSPPYYQDRNGGRPPRINQWNISLQREITQNLIVEVSDVGNHGVWLQGNSLLDLNALSTQRIASFGLDINNAADRSLLNSPVNSALAAARGFSKLPYAGFPATLTVAQTLRPYPQFGSIPIHYAPLGDSWYDGLQAKVTKRTSYGLTASGAFTWSKTLDLGAENSTGGGVINDVFNRPNQKALSAADQPFVFVTSINYRVPRPSVGNRLVRAALRDWTASVVLSYASGALIATPTAQNNLSTLLFRSTLSNRVPGVPLYTTDMNGPLDPTTQFVLNPKAWSDPAAGQWGYSAPYYSDFRARRTPNETGAFGRLFQIREKMNFELRIEFTNLFNRLVFPGASASNALATQVVNAQGIGSSGFGFIQTGSGVGGQRQGQLVARFQF
jgi:hypothetical protein